jgi:hypothetical protein
MIKSDQSVIFSRVSGPMTLAVFFRARVASRETILVASATVEQESSGNIQSSLTRRVVNGRG